MIERTRPAARPPVLRVSAKNGRRRGHYRRYIQEREEQALLVVQQAAFALQMQQKTELQREANALRDLQIEQMKRDDEIVRSSSE